MNPSSDRSNRSKSPSPNSKRPFTLLSEQQLQDCVRFLRVKMKEDRQQKMQKPSKKQSFTIPLLNIQSFFDNIQAQSQQIVQEDTEEEELESPLRKLMVELEGVQIVDPEKMHEQVSVHIALIAHNIITILIGRNQTEEAIDHSEKLLKRESIRNQIFQSILNYPNGQAVNEPTKWCKKAINQGKKNLLQLFCEGVYIPIVYLKEEEENQNECVSLKSISTKQQVQLRWEAWQRHQKLRFWISENVTCRVFQLIQSSSSKKLLLGEDGIGKSTATLLYKVLSERIHRLKYKISISQQSFTPFKALIDRIQFRIFKVVLISSCQNQLTCYIKNSVQRQLYEMKNNKRYSEFEYMKFNVHKQTISHIFQSQFNTEIVLIVDNVEHKISKAGTGPQKSRSLLQSDDHDCLSNLALHFQYLKLISARKLQEENSFLLEICNKRKKFRISTSEISSMKNINSEEITDLIIFSLESKIIQKKTISIRDDKNLQLARSYILKWVSSQSYTIILPSVITRYFLANNQFYHCKKLLQYFRSQSQMRLVERLVQFVKGNNSLFISHRYQILLKVMLVVFKDIENSQHQYTKHMFLNESADNLQNNQLTGHLVQQRFTKEVVFCGSLLNVENPNIPNLENLTIQQLTATNLLTYRKDTNIFKCPINPVLLIKTVQQVQKILHYSYEKEDHIIFEYIEAPDCIGKLFQSITIDMMLNGQTNLSLCLDTDKNQNSEKTTITFTNINPHPFVFFSIPTKNQRRSANYSFLESFQIVLNQTKGQILNQPSIFLPMYQPSTNSLIHFTRFQNYNMKLFLLNSKSIDCIICNFSNSTLQIICIDFTTSENQKIKEKIRSFIKGFLVNQDKHKTFIQFTDQSGQRKKISVQVDYLIWSLNPNKYQWHSHDFVASEIQKQGVNIADKGDYFECSLSSQKPFLLKKIFIVPNENILIECSIDPQGLRQKKNLIKRLKENLNKYYTKKQEYNLRTQILERSQRMTNLSEFQKHQI